MRNGHLVHVCFSKTHDTVGTKAFFEKVVELQEDTPEKVATD